MSLRLRAKNGLIVAVGAGSAFAVSSYHTAHNYNREIDGPKLAKWSVIFGVISGLIWGLTPAAGSEDEEVQEETLNAVREKAYPSIRTVCAHNIGTVLGAISQSPNEESPGATPRDDFTTYVRNTPRTTTSFDDDNDDRSEEDIEALLGMRDTPQPKSYRPNISSMYDMSHELSNVTPRSTPLDSGIRSDFMGGLSPLKDDEDAFMDPRIPPGSISLFRDI